MDDYSTAFRLQEKLVDDSLFNPKEFTDDGDNDDKTLKTQERILKKNKTTIVIVVLLVLVILITLMTIVFGVVLNNDSGSTESSNNESQRCQYNHPQYPYLGGGACSKECYSDGYASPPLNLKLAFAASSFSSQFQTDYERAGTLLASTGLSIGPGSDHVIDYDPAGMHMTLDYFCCYSEIEIRAIDEIAKTFEWPPIEVTFDKLICTKNDYSDSAELMILADEESQRKLLPIVDQFEAEMRAKGINVNVPRSENIGFHVTLAHVDERLFETNRMIDTINRNIEWKLDTMTMFNDSEVCPGPGGGSSTGGDNGDLWPQYVECLG